MPIFITYTYPNSKITNTIHFLFYYNKYISRVHHSLPPRRRGHGARAEGPGEARGDPPVLALQRLRQAAYHLHHHRLALLPCTALHAFREMEPGVYM